MMPADPSILNHSEEESKRESPPVLKLIDHCTEKAADVLLPRWGVWEQTSTNDDMVQEVATLLTPFESLHLSADDSSDASRDNLSSVEADNDDAIPLDLVPDVTLKPAVWSELELAAGYMDEDEEDEKDEQIAYILPSYESVYDASRP